MSPAEAFDDLMFHVDVSIRYHTRRRRFYENGQQVALFTGLMFALGTVHELMELIPAHLRILLGVAGAVVIVLSIIARAGAKASEHNDLKRRFIELQTEMERGRGSATEDHVKEWVAQRLSIQTDEPPINRVTHAFAYNELVRSKGMKNPRYVTIRWYHRLAGWATRAFDDRLVLGDPVPDKF